MAGTILQDLERNGIAILPDLISASQLADMQAAFRSRLVRMRWNNVDGYELSEVYRHMVNDVLTLDQAFLDIALHPSIKTALHGYLGGDFQLVEAKGWKTLPTRTSFHGWHADSWYDQLRVTGQIPREIKLGLYLTDVSSGAFVYVTGTHGQRHPSNLTREEISSLPRERFLEVLGPAGTVFLFDTTGFHRQNVPVLQAREAVFYAYHDPRIPLQAEDVAYNRYHPLLLNAAFLSDLTKEDQRILGFGDKTNYIRGFERKPDHSTFHSLVSETYKVQVRGDQIGERVVSRFRRLFGKRS